MRFDKHCKCRTEANSNAWRRLERAQSAKCRRGGRRQIHGRLPHRHELVEATLKIAARLRSTSASVVAHDDTLMRIAVCPCQTVPPHQHVPSPWTRAITSRVRSGLPNDTKTWLSTVSFST